MTKKNWNFIFLYILFIFCLLFMKFFDVEFIMSWSAFFTFLFLSTIILGIFIAIENNDYKKNEQKKQILLEQIAAQQIISIQEIEEPLLQELVLQNQDLQNNFLRLNEQQIKWIHDIKLPLATLQLFIRNNKATLSYENRKTLELIALNFDQLIEQKLMLDKVISNIDDMVIEKVNLYSLLIHIIKKLAPLIQFKQLQLTIEVDKDVTAISDAKILRYCFEQILSNAIKYTQGNGTIIIKTIETNKQIELLFIDNGIGVDSQDIIHVFDYGYTGKNGKNATKNASSGVGLYMVKKNLERLHHLIYVQSLQDDGTTIKIVFLK